MKVTVKKSSIKFKDIKPGYVYELTNGAKLIKLSNTAAAVISGYCDSEYFAIADGYLDEKTYPIKQVFGKLTEVVIGEE